jgi:hypothetical protein
MKSNEIKYCIMCEVNDKTKKATKFAKFNGDLIPLCDYHYKIYTKQHLEDLLTNEQSDK